MGVAASGLGGHRGRCWPGDVHRGYLGRQTLGCPAVGSHDQEPSRASSDLRRPVMQETCRRCGSINLIPDAVILDTDRLKVRVVVHGAPDALLFKQTMAGELRACICGDCGHTELHTKEYRDLWATYQDSLK